MFNVPKKFFAEEFPIKLIDLHKKTQLYVKRPPYQRKNVWSIPKQQKFIDSIFRRYYVPRVILRQVVPKRGEVKYEVIDGQQRINAVQNFFKEKFKTPDLSDLRSDISNEYYTDLPPEVQEYIEEQLLKGTLINGVDKPTDKKHQRLVSEIFWRLNEGMSLTYIEKEHSKLYSAVRNFMVKYADNISFDYANYKSNDSNPARHNFFELISQNNDRLQNLALLTRLLMIEFNDGPKDLNEAELTEFVDRFQGIKLTTFENRDEVKRCLKLLDILYKIFKDDEFKDKNGKVILFSREYFIISVYLLLRHLLNENYYFGREKYENFRVFADNFFKRWNQQDEKDDDIFKFRDKRQQDGNSLISRDIIIRKSFFKENLDMEKLDSRRAFKLWERIEIYQRERGICQSCGEKIPWSKFEADHIIAHSKKGKTDLDNAQLLCSTCNKKKSNK